MRSSTRRTSIQSPLDLAPEHAGSSALAFCTGFDILLLGCDERVRIICSSLDGALAAMGWKDICLEQGYGVTQTGDFLCRVDSRKTLIISAAKGLGAFYYSAVLITHSRRAAKNTRRARPITVAFEFAVSAGLAVYGLSSTLGWRPSIAWTVCGGWGRGSSRPDCSRCARTGRLWSLSRRRGRRLAFVVHSDPWRRMVVVGGREYGESTNSNIKSDRSPTVAGGLVTNASER